MALSAKPIGSLATRECQVHAMHPARIRQRRARARVWVRRGKRFEDGRRLPRQIDSLLRIARPHEQSALLQLAMRE